VEQTLKETCSIISNAILIGEGRKYLICLLTLKVQYDSDGRPTNNLDPSVQRFIYGMLNSKAKTIDEACDDPQVLNFI
jgi:long-chain-fatty-acid--CoA ligase ACSBG